MEDKYGKSKALEDFPSSSEDSEEGVEEDDHGEFATEALDAEISATLNAIRSKDPRVYDRNMTFYRATDDNEDSDSGKGNGKQSSMTLKQYHTENLLAGESSEDDEEAPTKTYAQEQAEARENAIKEFHAAAGSEDEEDDFLITKSKPAPSKERIKITEQDVENADKDPDTFLSNFMAARAWVPTAESRWKPLESDDEDDEERAEAYEDAYNMYFEDPAGTNEKIVTYARDAVASTTVRREEKSSRRKAREAARAKREAEKQEREEDLARLRKLKIEEIESKVKRIRKTAGMRGKDFMVNDWADVLEADWSDDQWDEEMRKRFGEAYYAEQERDSSDEEHSERTRKRPRKPKFDHDIEINDILPNFDDNNYDKAAFALSSDGEDDVDAVEEDGGGEEQRRPSESSKLRKQERADAKSAARRDRRLIESLVDSSLEYESVLAKSSKTPSRFRYRETSPTSFGLTSRDILLANDAQLNEFAGLKKLAAFRDPAKKKKDKKHLSKKARLRQWRLDTFGEEEAPSGGFEVLLGDESSIVNRDEGREDVNEHVDIRDPGKRKKKRNKKRKVKAVET